MRTFPRSLAAFRKFVNERCDQLRAATYEDLTRLETKPTERFTFDSRPATLKIFVQPRPEGRLRVVVQGFMKGRFVPGRHVALDGFYKHADGSATPMPDEEFYEFN